MSTYALYAIKYAQREARRGEHSLEGEDAPRLARGAADAAVVPIGRDRPERIPGEDAARCLAHERGLDGIDRDSIGPVAVWPEAAPGG